MYCGNHVVVAEWNVMNAFMVPLHDHGTPGDSWVLQDVLCVLKIRFVMRSLPQVHVDLY